MENDLMQKLVKSKAIMDVHNKIPRSGNSMPMGDNVDFSIPNARYNIPDDILSENEMTAPVMPIKNIETPSEDAIKKSRLPDEIKRIMLEHPIAQVQQPIGRNILTEEMV